MQCPECGAELELAEPAPPSLVGAYVRIACPRAGCGRAIVATVDARDGIAVRLLSAGDARREALAAVRGRQGADALAATFLALGGVGVSALALWQLVAGPGHAETIAYVIWLVVATAITGGPVLCFWVDLWLGRRAFLRTLPTAALSFVTKSEAYRR